MGPDRIALASDEQQIHAVHSTWIEAVNSGDLAALLALMTADAVFINPGQEPIGRDGFSAAFAAAHQRLLIRCESRLEEVRVSGEVACTRSRDSLSVTPRDGGEATQLAEYRLTIYRKQADARWLLDRDVHTLAPLGR